MRNFNFFNVFYNDESDINVAIGESEIDERSMDEIMKKKEKRRN